jgi:hypothetical protein
VRAAARRCGVTGRDRYRGRTETATPVEDAAQERAWSRPGYQLRLL